MSANNNKTNSEQQFQNYVKDHSVKNYNDNTTATTIMAQNAITF